jgi:hypothetical protein
MSVSDRTTERFDLARRIACWWRERRARRQGAADLARLGHDDFWRIAQDVGVDCADLQVLAGKWPSSADMLSRRMHELNLDLTDVSQVDPMVARDLQRVCSLCPSTRKCRRDLASHPSDPIWRQYCPNVMTIEALMTQRASRSNTRVT